MSVRKAIAIQAVVIIFLTLIVYSLERRIIALERTKMDYDIHFGYKSHFPAVGEFGVYEKGGGAK